MRVLYATLRPPFPPKLGDQLIAWEQITRVGRDVELSLLTFDEGLEDEGELRRRLEPFCDQVTILRGVRDRRRLWRSVVRQRPFLVDLFDAPHLHAAVRACIDTLRPDVIHVQSIHIAEYFNDARLPKVLDMVDVLSRNMARRAVVTPMPRRLLYRREARVLHAYESAALRHYDRVLLVAGADAAAHPGHAFCINPNGIRITSADLARGTTQPQADALVFHGNMSYAANVDAARFLCREVMPRVRESRPVATLYIVGYEPAPAVRALHDGSRVVVTGGVDDVVPHLTRCVLGVYPLRLGSGMPNKVLDALACGLACVVSPLALAGIEHACDGTHLAVASDAASWVETIVQLLADAPRRARLGQQGQQMVRAQYSWERNVACLLDTWRAAVGVDARVAPS